MFAVGGLPESTEVDTAAEVSLPGAGQEVSQRVLLNRLQTGRVVAVLAVVDYESTIAVIRNPLCQLLCSREALRADLYLLNLFSCSPSCSSEYGVVPKSVLQPFCTDMVFGCV